MLLTNLAPAAFAESPNPSSAFIAGSYPDGARTWRNSPAAGLPLIGGSIPTMIAADPYMVRARSYAPFLDHGYRRGYPDNYFSARRAYS